MPTVVIVSSSSSSSDSLESLSSPISIHGTSSSSDDDSVPLHFKVRLYHDYKNTAVLPKKAQLGEGSRWVLIKTGDAETYKVEMVDDVGAFLLQRGWSILAAVENLQEDDRLMFRAQNSNTFDMWIHSPSQHAPRIGFSPERVPPAPIDNLGIGELIRNREVELDDAGWKAVQKVWNASSYMGPVYVCRLLISPTIGKCLIFNKEYSSLLPKKRDNVAMRFVGSDVIIPGVLKTYTDGCARMVKPWDLYASEHHLTIGELFVCKIHRGPASWEFIGACARGD